MTAVEWDHHQAFEASWWGDCTNTYGEVAKQLVYARKMGLRAENVGGPGPVIDLGGRRVIDIGGGPDSLLLKTVNRGPCSVVDPCPYPEWVAERYRAAGIHLVQLPGEQLTRAVDTDEVWIYNVLQHTSDPARILRNAALLAPRLRLFEWVGIPAHEGHPHELTIQGLHGWLKSAGYLDPTSFAVADLNESGCAGTALYGVFSR